MRALRFLPYVVVGLLVSLPTHAADTIVKAAFPASGISRVVLRASAAASATVEVVESSQQKVEVQAVPSGGAAGYHSPDPNWRETSAAQWGLGFVGKAYGSVLIVSASKEIQYIHHHYALTNIKLTVPAGVEVVREPRELSGDGTPNLSAP